MKKTRILAVLCALTACFQLAACSNTQGSSSGNESPGADSELSSDNESDGASSKDDESCGNEVPYEPYKREQVELTDLTRSYDGEYSAGQVAWTEQKQDGMFSAGSGVYENEFELTLSGGEIYYTTDGSDPAISDTAIKYEGPITITDRKNEPNVVSAVDPLEISGALNEVAHDRKSFTCNVSAPSDGAVDKCTVIRAAVKNADGTFGETQTETYFIGSLYDHIDGIGESSYAQQQPLAVISISMDYDDLFDSKRGIYVKGDIFYNALEEKLKTGGISSGEDARGLDANYKQRGREWEREASINFFESDGAETNCVLSQNCGIRIQGNYSRSDLQKGFRLYARTDYGDNNFRYEVFDGLTDDNGDILDKYKSLVLRAGGNCAFTTKYSDTYWQSLLTDYDCDMKTSRPCVVYLNGEYWGLYVLEEDYQADYFEDHHFVNKDDVILYKGDAEKYASGYKLDLGDVPEGQDEGYYFSELMNFFQTHDSLKSDEDFESFCILVDPQSAMDYFAAEIWINNKWDWPGKNWSMWKTKNTDFSNEYSDGRWRFVYYDMEFGGVSGSGDCRTNTIKEDNYKKYGLLDTDTNNPAVLCFAYLMTNEGWRSEFYAELEELGTGAFSEQRAKGQLDWINSCYEPLYDQFFERYEGAGTTDNAVNGGYASYRCISDFLDGRAGYIPKMIQWCDNTLEKMY